MSEPGPHTLRPEHFDAGRPVPTRWSDAAHGQWAQVYVDRETRRPVPIPDAVRTHLKAAVALRAATPDTAGGPR